MVLALIVACSGEEIAPSPKVEKVPPPASDPTPEPTPEPKPSPIPKPEPESIPEETPPALSGMGEGIATFLSDYWSLFSVGELHPDGTFHDTWWSNLEPLQPGEIPLVYIEYVYDSSDYIFDRWGNVLGPEMVFIEEEEWGYLFLAVEFSLIDLDDDGVPEILIYYIYPLESEFFNAQIFRYIDGRYQKSEMDSFHQIGTLADQFFRDDDGQIYMTQFAEGESSLERLTFRTDGSIAVETIIDWVDWERRDYVDDAVASMTEIEPLDELKQQVIEWVLYYGVGP